MANIEVSIKIDIKPTKAERSSDKTAEQPIGAIFAWCWTKPLSWTSMRWKTACSGRATRRCGMPWRSILEQAIKKALRRQHQRGASHRLRRHVGDYRVEGEVGRFTFALFDVIDTEERPVFEGRCLLPPRQGRQWYQAWGFKELALLHGAAQRSYRQTVEGLTAGGANPREARC